MRATMCFHIVQQINVILAGSPGEDTGTTFIEKNVDTISKTLHHIEKEL